MSNYKNILVAIDINANYETIINKALSVCSTPDDISLTYIPVSSVYIQPFLYGAEYSIVDDSERLAIAKKQLEEIAKKFGINPQQVYLNAGEAADEIKQIANEKHADLIVIGTHGRGGFKALLGSTTNDVLHGSKQDVLAVRVYEEK